MSAISTPDLRRYISGGRTTLDRIIETYLRQFCKENEIVDLREDAQFEHFVAYCVLKQHHNVHFSTAYIVTGDANEDTDGDRPDAEKGGVMDPKN